MKTVAVIGAGPAGLCALKHLTARPAHFRAVCFERAGRVGGTWVYTDQVGTDDDGLPVHAAMYESLRTNLPKDIMMFPGFPFSSPLPSFNGHEEMLEYIDAYTDHYNLRRHIKFRTLVTSVSPLSPEKPETKWRITTSNLTSPGNSKAQEFDAVLVCNGQFVKPYIPAIPGMEWFPKSSISHVHDFRSKDPYRGKVVVVVGAGRSGLDMCLELAPIAKQIYFSYHYDHAGLRFAENVVYKPDIHHLTETASVFNDGTEVAVDHIILCTGYRYDFPFLTADCGVVLEDDGKRVTPVFKHMVNTTHPTMIFIGLPQFTIPFLTFDIQMQVVMKVLGGELTLPSKEDMDSDTAIELEERMKQGMPSRRFHYFAGTSFTYLDGLSDLAKVPKAPKCTRLLLDRIFETIRDNVQTYKYYNYEMTDGSFNVLGNTLNSK